MEPRPIFLEGATVRFVYERYGMAVRIPEVGYKMASDSFRPKVFEKGRYKIVVEIPETGFKKILPNIMARKDTKKSVRVVFGGGNTIKFHIPSGPDRIDRSLYGPGRVGKLFFILCSRF